MLPLDIDAVLLDYHRRNNEDPELFEFQKEFLHHQNLCKDTFSPFINPSSHHPFIPTLLKVSPMSIAPNHIHKVTTPAKSGPEYLDPDTITVGKYYVARRPTLLEQKQYDPIKWDHCKTEGKALKCISVGERGQTKLRHKGTGVDYGDYQLYDYRLLRLATTDEIREVCSGESNCYKPGCPITVFHNTPGEEVFCEDHVSCICYAPEHCSCKGPGGAEKVMRETGEALVRMLEEPDEPNEALCELREKQRIEALCAAEVKRLLDQQAVEEEGDEIEEPVLLTASEVMEEVSSEHYESAAEIVAFRKAQAEINQHALTPGMVVYHIFKHYPCVLIEETKGKWEIELESGKRENDVEAALLSPIVPSCSQRFMAAYKRDTRFRNLAVLFALLGTGLAGLAIAALTTLAVTGNLAF